MLSNSCSYGIRAVVYLARKKDTPGKTGIRQISKDLALPTPFLAKIMQELAKQKILSSSKGPNGGFSLQKDPRKITLSEIVRAIDGEDFFSGCIMQSGRCGNKRNKKYCSLHADYDNIRQELIMLFNKKTIQELAIESDNNGNVAI